MSAGKATEGKHEIEETSGESEGTTGESGGEGILMLIPSILVLCIYTRCYERLEDYLIWLYSMLIMLWSHLMVSPTFLLPITLDFKY